jgi:hypothetical protein
MSRAAPTGRFQFVRYPLCDIERDDQDDLRVVFNLSSLGRFGLWPFEGSMRLIYRWRFVFGPFEIRRWAEPEDHPYDGVVDLYRESAQ